MSQRKKLKRQPKDLRKEYDAPFSIISRNEGSRYASLTNREFNPPRFLDFQEIGRLGWTNPIDAYCRTLSLKKLVEMRHNGYRQLMLEFYTTLRFQNDDGFQCRLMGKSVTVTLKNLCDIFGFSEGGHKTVPKDFDPAGFWKEIAGDGGFKSGKMVSMLIKDPGLLFMYKYIAHGIFGKDNSGLVSFKELFCLWCAYTDVPVCTPCFVLGAFKSIISKKRARMGLGNFITAIAIHFGAFNPLDSDMLALPTKALGLKKYLKDYKCDKSATEDSSSSSSSSHADEGEDSGPDAGEDSDPVTNDDQPAADTWMLISGKLEQIHTQMNDGFHAIESRLDGLEKMVNDNAVQVRSLEQKMKGLGKVESNSAKTVEEMTQKNFEANISIEKLRLEKSESDKAAEIYKAKLEILFPKLKKIQECLPMISSMKVADLANLVTDMRELDTFEVGENLGFPNVNAEEVVVLLPGVHATSTANGSRNKGLPNNGDGNSPQPRTSEDDIAHSVKKSLGSVAHASGKHIMSGEKRFCKTTLSPSAAAGDTIIEIYDSDNEAKSNRAAKISKRVMSSDVGENETKISKRNKTERMGKSSPVLKKSVCTIDEDNVLTRDKGKEALKSSHDDGDISADSGDDSLSDSRIEGLVASLRREKCL